MRVFLLLFISVALSTMAVGQSRVHLKHADRGKRGIAISGEKYDRLLGNVVLTQNLTTIYCDSAHLFRDRNYVEAYGTIRITEGDSVTITGKYLEYDGTRKLAKLRKQVVFTKLATATLHTDYLDYDRLKNMAYYFNGGNLVDSINTLTSRKGYYDVTSNMASFRKEVVVVNPDYTMTSDSLQYNSTSKIIYFRTSTRVVDKDSGVFVYETGFYETAQKQSSFATGVAENEKYKLVAGRYRLDDFNKRYFFEENVVMTYKTENLIIYGQKCWNYKDKGISKVFDRAYLAKITEDNDTLFMAADTLVAIDNDDPKQRKFLAYNNVRIYKNDLQGIADSLEYRSLDSTIYFYRNPVLWTNGNQLSADSIHMLIEKNTISKVFLRMNSFVISSDTLNNFNQIKGRTMLAQLSDGDIYRVFVNGNGETIYYATEADKKSGLIITTGMSKTICSNIIIRFAEGRVSNLTFLKKPDSKFIPPHEFKPDDKILKGFEWRGKDRPTRKSINGTRLETPN